MLLAVLLVSAVSAFGLQSQYTDEYNLDSEICAPTDQFYFQDGNTILLTTVLNCCSSQTCTTMFIDESGEHEFLQAGAVDVANSYYARNLMRAGSFSENMYLLKDSFALCNFFDFNVLRDQSVSFAVEGVERGSEVFIPKQAENVKEVSSILKGANFVKKLNLYDLGASVVCTAQLNKRQEVIQKVAECYSLAVYLRYGRVRYGTVDQLETCNSKASQMIDELEHSLTQRTEDSLNKIAAIIKAIWEFFMGETDKITVQQTELEQLHNLNTEIGGGIALKNPNATIIASNSIHRLNEKKTSANIAVNSAKESYDSLQIDGMLTRFFNNFLKEPDRNYSMVLEKRSLSKSYIANAKTYFESRKYNSAIAESNKVMVVLAEAQVLNSDLKNQAQHFDWRVIIAGLIISIIMVVIWNKRPKDSVWQA